MRKREREREGKRKTPKLHKKTIYLNFSFVNFHIIYYYCYEHVHIVKYAWLIQCILNISAGMSIYIQTKYVFSSKPFKRRKFIFYLSPFSYKLHVTFRKMNRSICSERYLKVCDFFPPHSLPSWITKESTKTATTTSSSSSHSTAGSSSSKQVPKKIPACLASLKEAHKSYPCMSASQSAFVHALLLISTIKFVFCCFSPRAMQWQWHDSPNGHWHKTIFVFELWCSRNSFVSKTSKSHKPAFFSLLSQPTFSSSKKSFCCQKKYFWNYNDAPVFMSLSIWIVYKCRFL